LAMAEFRCERIVWMIVPDFSRSRRTEFKGQHPQDGLKSASRTPPSTHTIVVKGWAVYFNHGGFTRHLLD
jgi:hypothetical protein